LRSITRDMNLSAIKMVVTDMDGTLLNSRHEVSQHFFELYEELKKREILFVAASGRQYNSIAEKLSQIQSEIIIIAENGGLAIHNDQELISTPLDPISKNAILEILGQIDGAFPVLCGKHNAYILGDSPEFINTLKEYYTKYEILDNLQKFDSEVMKIAVYHYGGSEKHIYPAVKHLEGKLKVKVSGENWVDLSHINAHKGFALKKIQEQHGIGPEETLVFGDYNNDLEMLALAKYSFAMANSHPNVLKAANYITLSNNDFGVEHILKKLIKDKN
jgi:Cof subfamily protein (haloacid dehalogenase superfamily)